MAIAETEEKKVRVVVLKGRSVMNSTTKHGTGSAKTHGENAELLLPASEAENLIALGFVREAGAEDEGRKTAPVPKVGSDTAK